ncbi:PIN domain-containing protein [Treponema sp. OttesenSCG-928-L16]|nr:PIN domain-containing protein [Treponema sp. OttesenSCG-928-L16]
MTYIFDACALIAFLGKEPEGLKTKEFLDRATAGEFSVYMNIINLAEVYYHYIHDVGIINADEIMRYIDILPIGIIDTISEAIYRTASRYKGLYPISLADAFAAATASALSATLITKDDEFRQIKAAEKLSIK